MPALLETQRALRDQLLGSACAGSADEELLAIYRHSAQSTLVNALRLSFPAVQRLVGAEFFAGAALKFIAGHAPRSAYLNEYGAEWAAFLAQFPPAAAIAYLAEVARLEWAVNGALHAPDAASLDLSRLQGLKQEQLARLRFRLHPALSLLQLSYPADAIWRAVLEQDDAAMAAIDLHSGPVQLLIERCDRGAVQVQRLTPTAWAFTQRLSDGYALCDAIGDAAPAQLGEINLLLAEHLARGRFHEID